LINKRLLLLISLFAATGLPVIGFPINGFAQAAAESALTNALSSSSAVKGGSELGHALDRGSRQLGARIQQQTQNPVQPGLQSPGVRSQGPVRQLKNPPAAAQPGANLYAGSTAGRNAISIQGGEMVCGSADQGGQASTGSIGTGAALTNCHAHQTASKPVTAKSGTEDKYKSYVRLPAPK
jgi:hypothetical protein